MNMFVYTPKHVGGKKMARFQRLLVGFIVCSFFVTRSVAADWEPRSGFSHVAKIAMPAVVFIQVEKRVSQGTSPYGRMNDPRDYFGDEFLRRFFGHRSPYGSGRPREFIQRGQGSGFVISKDGYILTNSHVVGDADKVTVRLKDGRTFPAESTWSDPKSEVAMIKIDADDLPTIELGSSTGTQIGDWVVAVGNPFGLAETLTVGVISAKGRNNIGIADYEDFIQTDAAINPGNSGGPLLNVDGEAIGINTAIYSRSGGYMGIGFAIPIDMAVGIKDRLLADGKVNRGFIGISMNPGPLDDEMAAEFGLDDPGGVLIADVVQDGAADKAGLKAGDVITHLNGARITNNSAFRNKIAMTTPGTVVELTVIRYGKEKQFDVRIGSLDGSVLMAGNISEKLGLSVQAVDEALAKRFALEGEEGVLITEVKSGSPADDARLKPGLVILSVNRNPISDVDAFHKAIKDASKSDRVVLRVKGRNGTWFSLLRID